MGLDISIAASIQLLGINLRAPNPRVRFIVGTSVVSLVAESDVLQMWQIHVAPETHRKFRDCYLNQFSMSILRELKKSDHANRDGS